MLLKDEPGPTNESNAKIVTGNGVQKLGKSHIAEDELICS